ncbi:MAG: hypothetical protein M0003_09435 [Acidithiobacillus sp.]|nr:hypothetical protein [Acidithiobacillus sp.]
MEVMELIQRSKAAAELAWDAVKVSNPAQPGMTMRHADVPEGDHHYAREILDGSVSAQEYGGVRVDRDLIDAARNLVDFLQYHTGWGDPTRVQPLSGNNMELGIASMIQYQNRIREQHQMGMAGNRAQAGMERLLVHFAALYPVGHPEASVRTIQEKLDPLFEDGLRLSDHQRMAVPSMEAAATDPQLDRLARQLASHPQTPESRVRSDSPRSSSPRSGPRADDPWGMNA